jgi:hypothetical protein
MLITITLQTAEMFQTVVSFCGERYIGLESPGYGRGDPLRWLRDIIYPQKLALTLPTSGGRSVGIVHSRIKTTEFGFVWFLVSATYRFILGQ